MNRVNPPSYQLCRIRTKQTLPVTPDQAKSTLAGRIGLRSVLRPQRVEMGMVLKIYEPHSCPHAAPGNRACFGSAGLRFEGLALRARSPVC